MSILPVLGVLILLLIIGRPIRITEQWNRAVILRLGRFRGLSGPGLFFVVPFIDRVALYVDLRVRTATIDAESTLTRDTVSVTVNAIVFWRVVDVEKAALGVQNYEQNINRAAQTSLRELIGATDLSVLLSDRATFDEKLRHSIARKIEGWGVEVQSVDINDVAIPRELQEAMSRQAQAERERQARVTLASAEQEIAQKIMDGAEIYGRNPIALELRRMGLMFEMNKDRGATIIIPSAMADSLGNGAMLATALSAALNPEGPAATTEPPAASGPWSDIPPPPGA